MGMNMTKKYISEFVKRMRELTARLKPRLVWNSSMQGTYRREKYGELE